VFVSPRSILRPHFEVSKEHRTPHNGSSTSIPEQQQAYSTSGASKRIALSFSLSVLGLPQMKLEKKPIALQKSRELSPKISSKNG
jgi:hypothetical protein